MTDEKYNGWTNHETWLVNLWLTNEPGTAEHAGRIARFGPLYQAADALRQWTADGYLRDVPSTGLAADLISGALALVDWREIVQHFREP